MRHNLPYSPSGRHDASRSDRAQLDQIGDPERAPARRHATNIRRRPHPSSPSAARAARHPRRGRTPDPRPTSAGPPGTRTPGHTTDGTDASPEQFAAHQRDQAQLTTRNKPRVERPCSMSATTSGGEAFVDLADAQARAEAWCARAGLKADPRHHPAPPRRGVRRARSGLPAAGPGSLRPADLHGEGAPRLPRRGRQGALLGPRRVPGSLHFRPAPTASSSSSTSPAVRLVQVAAGW